MRKLLLLAGATFILSACNMNTNDTPASPSPEAEAIEETEDNLEEEENENQNDNQNEQQGTEESLTFQLQEQSNSNQTGTVRLEPVDGKTRIIIMTTGANFPQPQPAHIHAGTCENIGRVIYPLENVVNGRSTTTLNVDIEEIRKLMEGDLKVAVNLHKSAQESNVYTACADME